MDCVGEYQQSPFNCYFGLQLKNYQYVMSRFIFFFFLYLNSATYSKSRTMFNKCRLVDTTQVYHYITSVYYLSIIMTSIVRNMIDKTRISYILLLIFNRHYI